MCRIVLLFGLLLLFTGCTPVEVAEESNKKVETKKTVATVKKQPKFEKPERIEAQVTRVSAIQVLENAFDQARMEDKNVFVRYSSPSCGWCGKLEEFLNSNREMYSHDYVMVKIDVAEMDNASDLFEQHRDGRVGGLPWMIILDADGYELITSVGPKGNCGCPVEPKEIDHFVKMIKETCTDPDKAHMFAIRESLKEYAEIVKNGRKNLDQ